MQHVMMMPTSPAAPRSFAPPDAVKQSTGPIVARALAHFSPGAMADRASMSQGSPSGLMLGTDVSSIGDPHEKTGDGMAFDNMRRGHFVKLRAVDGDFELQTRQDPWKHNRQTTVNTAAAVKVNKDGDRIVYDATTDRITLNGKPIEVMANETFKLPGGGSVEKTADGYAVTSARGDKVNLVDRGDYIDVNASVAKDRKSGEVRGSLGAIDADSDARNDMVGRDGQAIEDVEAFLDEWSVKDGESLFTGTPAADPVGGTGPGGEDEPGMKDKPGMKDGPGDEDEPGDGNEPGGRAGLTKSQIEGLFMFIDADADGQIDLPELTRLIERLAAFETLFAA